MSDFITLKTSTQAYKDNNGQYHYYDAVGAPVDVGGKVQLVYSGSGITINRSSDGSSVNFQQMMNYLKVSPNFTYLLYGNRAYLPSLIEDDSQGMHYIYFESTMVDGGLSKNAVIAIYSTNGVDISGINKNNVANENYNNKVAEITDRNKTSTGSYTSVKAVADYVDMEIENVSNDVTILKSNIAEFETIEPFEISLDDIANTDTYPRHMGFINSSGKWTYIGDSRYQYIAVPLQGYGAMAMIVAGGAYAATFAAVKNYVDPVSGDTAIFSTEAAWTQKVTVAKNGIAALDVPSDATHLLVWVAYSSYGDITPVSFEMTVNGKSGKFLTRTGTKWCAMGDSITAGYMSYGTNTDPHYREIKQTCWVTRVADANGWIVTNEGVGGTGWNKPVNADGSQEGESGDAEVDVTSAHALAQIMASDPERAFTNFDFVTLGFGINDWKGNRVVGSLDDPFDFDATPTTAIAGMRKTIETIIRNNPAIKIFVITPFNCVGYYKNGRNPYYSPETNHALGHNYETSGTLESFVSEMIRVCDYYGIQYIDETHYSCVNRMNIMQMLTDGVHPNAHCHKLIAMEMAKKITIA